VGTGCDDAPQRVRELNSVVTVAPARDTSLRGEVARDTMPGVATLVRRLVEASHPGPVVGVTTASAAYAIAIGRGDGGVVAVVAAVLAGQLSVGWHNDWLDAGRDALAGRRDKPVARGVIDRATVRHAAIAAAIVTIPASLASGWRAGAVHIAAVAAAWGYNARVKSTAWSAAPYAVAFGLLPVFISLGARGAPLGPWWAPAASALLGTGAHFMNALPDLEQDMAAGVSGLPHRLGRERSLALAIALLLAASVVLALGSRAPRALGAAGLGISLVCVVVARRAARDHESRVPFSLAIVVALVDVVLLLLAGHTAA